MYDIPEHARAAEPTVTARPGSRRAARSVFVGLLAAAVAALLFGAQSALFYAEFSPRVAEANQLLYDLMIESSQRTLFRKITSQIAALRKSGALTTEASVEIEDAWRDFGRHFTTAPAEAIGEMQAALAAFGGAGSSETIESLRNDFGRLQKIHTDRYEPLIDELESPPMYLWPSAHVLADRSGYRGAMILNRALYLAQIGEVGTARVLLTGLQASTEDSRITGLIYFMLGRLQFEVFRARPEAELYLQSVQYLRESLRADPDSQLAKRFMDYLLSLDRRESVPRAGQGRPTVVSEGEGAAISEDERRF